MVMAGGQVSAQIVNVQPILGSADEEGLQAEIGGSVDYKTGNVELLIAKGSLLATYRRGDHRVISSSMGNRPEGRHRVSRACIYAPALAVVAG